MPDQDDYRPKPPRRTALPLSLPTRRRMLAFLVARADQGDVAAAEALVRLSLQRSAAYAAARAGA